MTDSQIVRAEQWDRRHLLCKYHGYCAAIVYQGSTPSGGRVVACNQRIRVKTWAAQRYGAPCRLEPRQTVNHKPKLTDTDSEWYQGYNDQGEYVIAFRTPKWRDWALLL